MNPIQSLCALALLAALMAVVSCNKDETLVKVYDGPDEMQKRDKFSKGFNTDYSHLRFGRADPDLVIPPYYNPYYDKRASYGNDYGHMRFGRRGPSASFTDYGHLRFGR